MADDSTAELAEIYEELSLEEMAGAGAEAMRKAGQDVSESDVKEAVARAQEMVRERKNPLDEEGHKDMVRLAMSIGAPVPRILLGALIDKVPAKDSRKKEWRRRHEQLYETKETGCITVEFSEAATGTPMKKYLLLDTCKADHDLGAELDKIFSRVGPEKKEEILKHVSMLVNLGRSAYEKALAEGAKLWGEVHKKIAQSDLNLDARRLVVGYENTTIYIEGLPEGPRAGIFVRDA